MVLWVLGLMAIPAVASVIARLSLREGFSDVSFRFNGRRGWMGIGFAVTLPIVVGGSATDSRGSRASPVVRPESGAVAGVHRGQISW